MTAQADVTYSKYSVRLRMQHTQIYSHLKPCTMTASTKQIVTFSNFGPSDISSLSFLIVYDYFGIRFSSECESTMYQSR